MRKVIPFQKATKTIPTRDDLTSHLRVLAQDDDNMGWIGDHFPDRLRQRGLTMRQVIEVIKHGECVSGPTLDEYGDWRIKLKRVVAGRRVQVVVAVKEHHFDIVTAI